MQPLSELDPNRIAAVAALLVAFGYAYDQAYTRAARLGWTSGHVHRWVIIGTGAVLAGLAAAGFWLAALVALGLFAAAGVPMALGERLRYAEDQQREQREKLEVRERLAHLMDDERQRQS